MRRLLLVAMLAAVCGFAQTGGGRKGSPGTPAAPPKWPIESVTIEGARHYTREQILAAAGLRIGEPAGRADFEAARLRLLATGAFETVGYKFTPGGSAKGYSATLQLTEIEQAYPARFEDLHISEREAEAAIQAKDPLFSMARLPATQPVLERSAKAVQAFLASKGIDEKVAASVAMDSPGEYWIVFRSARPLPAVAHVRFRGNEVLKENTLWEAISATAVGMPYTEDSFREMLTAGLRPLYEARGRVHVTFPEIRTQPAQDVQGLTVTVTIDEGESYTLGKVAIEGAPIDTAALLKEGDFKTGDIANFDLVNQGIERIAKAVRRAGYIDAAAATSRKRDDGKTAVDVLVHVDAGPRFTMGKLNLEGLDLEGEAEIKRMWGLKPGAPFNPDYPDHFLASVRERGVFDRLGKTRAETKPRQQDHTVDVTLIFTGDPGQGKPSRSGRGGR